MVPTPTSGDPIVEPIVVDQLPRELDHSSRLDGMHPRTSSRSEHGENPGAGPDVQNDIARRDAGPNRTVVRIHANRVVKQSPMVVQRGVMSAQAASPDQPIRRGR